MIAKASIIPSESKSTETKKVWVTDWNLLAGEVWLILPTLIVRGVDLLMHEHETLNVPNFSENSQLEDLISKGGHVTTEGAAVIAKEAKVKKLYLIHHNPPCDWLELEKDLKKAKKIFPESFLANDLEEIEF